MVINTIKVTEGNLMQMGSLENYCVRMCAATRTSARKVCDEDLFSGKTNIISHSIFYFFPLSLSSLLNMNKPAIGANLGSSRDFVLIHTAASEIP